MSVSSLRLKETCARQRITLTELARRSSIPQPSLSRYESGACDITLRQLNRIALALNVGIEQLIHQGTFLQDLRGTIEAMEKSVSRQDKVWVTRVLSDLQEHYRKARI